MNNSKTILVFDDDELIGKTLANMGLYSDIEVKYTDSYEIFLQLIESWQPSYIVLDLIMPEVDGIDVLTTLVEKKIRSNIIIASGVGIRVLEAAGRSAAAQGLNVVGILPKPFSPKQFRVLLDSEPGKQSDTLIKQHKNGNKDSGLITEKLQLALKHDALDIALQPKFDCKMRQLRGFEVLARWYDANLGVVTPDVFIAIAENQGMINELTLQVCRKAFGWFGKLLKSNESQQLKLPDSLSLSINISAISLASSTTMEAIHSLRARHGINPEQIIFELTETAAMDEPLKSLDLLTQLRMKGYRLSIDDFGTGYSSMLQLVRLPFSELKIDKSFVLTAKESRESKVVIKAIVELALTLGLEITAEGVEDEDTLTFLKDIGCSQVQGFLLSKPLAPDRTSDFLLKNQHKTEQRRLAALHAYNLMDTKEEYRFDRITRLATRLFKVSISVVSLLEQDRNWFKAKTGVSAAEIPRSVAFCEHTIRQEEAMVVTDTLLDKRFAENVLVIQAPYIRFYAGYPIYSPEREVFGAFCIMDSQPREFSSHEITMLADLAAMVEEEIATSSQLAEDYLTGLLNRRSFEKRADEVLAFSAREELYVTLIYFDLDKFKFINDSHGHQVGDQVLKFFANCLGSVFRTSDLLARLGGDEFVVLLVNRATVDLNQALERLAEQVSAVQEQVPELNELEFSAGFATSIPAQPKSIQELYQMADSEMYKEKKIKSLIS